MTGFRDRFSDEAKRAKKWAKSARVTAEVATTAVNPLAGPVLQQASLEPAEPLTEISQSTTQDQQKDWAHYAVQRREQENAALPVAPTPTQATPSREANPSKPTREARRSRER